jgi:hypothetical protein
MPFRVPLTVEEVNEIDPSLISSEAYRVYRKIPR